MEPSYGPGLALGMLIIVVMGAGYRMLARTVPRSSDHQVIGRNLSTRLSVAAAAARTISFILVAALAAGVAANALSALIGLDRPDPPLVQAAIILLTAMVAMTIRRPAPKLVAAAIVPAAVCVLGIIVGGLVIELAGGLTKMPDTEMIDGRPISSWPVGRTALGALLPAAILGLLAERSYGEGGPRRIRARSLARALGPVIAAIAALLYLSRIIDLASTTRSTPVLALAEAIFGETPAAIAAASFCVAGIAISFAAAGQAVALMRQLAGDGILPRRAAAADARRPRNILLGLTVLLCAAAVLLVADSASTMLVVIMLGTFTVIMAGMIARARAIRRESIVLDDRVSARQTTLVASLAGFVSAFATAMAFALQPVFSLAALVVLGILTAGLIVLRRGAGKIGARLAASDLSHGRPLPTRVHAIVLVERLDRPTLQAITYARATRPSTMIGLVVDVDPEATETLIAHWTAAELPVELRILGTPRGAARRPVIDHVRTLRQAAPRDIVIIYAPRVVSSSAAWQRFFVRHSTPALLSELKLEPGVIVAEVPYQIEDVEE